METVHWMIPTAFVAVFSFVFGSLWGINVYRNMSLDYRKPLEDLQENAKRETQVLIDHLEEELLEMHEKRTQREKEHAEELRRIERMFTLHKLGKVSDEEFKEFLLE